MLALNIYNDEHSHSLAKYNQFKATTTSTTKEEREREKITNCNFIFFDLIFLWFLEKNKYISRSSLFFVDNCDPDQQTDRRRRLSSSS
jgi:hypothetical protein